MIEAGQRTPTHGWKATRRPKAARFALASLLAATMVLAASLARAATPTPSSIVVVSDDNYPPYVFRDADGTLRGILHDHWTLWQQKTGVPVDFKAMDWADALRLMAEGQADVVDTIFRTPERERLYDFTPPYAEIRVPVYKHKDLGGIADYPSLKGFAVGVKSGDAVIDHLRQRGIDSFVEYPSYEAIVHAAARGEIKVFSVDEPAAVYHLYKLGVADDYRRAFVLYTGEFHRAVAKGRPELLALVRRGFDAISPAEYAAIDRKWLGARVEWNTALRRFGLATLAAAAVLLLLGGGNLLLRRQVRIQTAELRRNRARLENILRLAPVGICVVRRRIVLEANARFCETLGRAPEELIGQSTRLIYASDADFESYGREFYSQIAASGFVRLELSTRNKAGAPLTIWVNGAPLDPARPDEEIIFTALDITDRKKTEADLIKSREYFATLFDSISDAVFIDDAATGAILDVNRRMVEMYGFSSREEAVAAGLAPLCSGIPPYTVQEAAEWVRKTREEGPQVFEWHARRADGTLFWAEVCIRRVLVGTDDRLIVSARDITERKLAEEDRLEYERHLRESQKLESLGLLAGGIAHDFNNILTAILGNVDLALLEIPPDSAARNDLAIAIDATHRAADLARQMLAYSGKGHFVIEPLDLAREIRSTTQMLQASIPKNTELAIELPTHLPAIVADASQIRQVVMNLVINASEALENKPGTVRISAGVSEGADWPAEQLRPRSPLPAGPYVYLQVEDNGSGIRPECLDRIFDPFFSSKFTGRGLGLSAVLGIVRGHNGAIRVESAPGKGSRFQAFFPASSLDPAAPTARNGQTQAAPGTQAPWILLVDDEAHLRDTTSKLLARMGCLTVCAEDGEKAVDIFRSRADEFSAVVLDLAMPKMDGAQAFAELRKIRPDVPVLLSSGYAEPDVLQRFGDGKPDGFLQKPYTFDALRQALLPLIAPNARASSR